MPETPLSQAAVYNARPTLQVDNQQHDELHHLLTSMEMVEAEGGMSSLELRVQNVVARPSGGSALAWDDGSVLKLGASLVVEAGDVAAPQEIFRGTITGIEGRFPEDGAPEVSILAEDALQRARMARRTAVYTNKSVADLATTIAQQLSLTPQVTGLSQPVAVQVQLDESDLAFLRRVLAAHDADVQVVGTDLIVAPRGNIQRGTVELHLYSQLRSARLLADLSHQATAVTVTGWDPAQGSAISARSTGQQLGPGSGSAGAQVLQQALGSRSEHLRDLAVLSQAEAEALAHASFDQRARRFVVVEGTAEGNPALRVGTHLRLQGLSSRWDNTYYVVRATHRYDREEGYRTDFEAESSYVGVA